MKKFLALFLAVVMLLGLVAMTASATGEETVLTENSYGVSLGDDISLTFYFVGQTGSVDVEIYEGENLLKTFTGAAADANGIVTVTYAGLTPADIDTQYTAKIKNTETSITHSVLDYCEYQLTNMNESNELWALIVDLLNYSAASQAYNGETVTANVGLTDLQKRLGTAAPAASTLLPDAPVGEQTLAIQWTYVAPALGDSVAYRFFYTGETTGVTFYVNDVAITPVFGTDATYGKYVELNTLKPSDLRTDMIIVAKNAEGAEVSAAKTFSAERYAAAILANADSSAELKALVKSIVSYADSAIAYTDETANTNTIINTGLTTIQSANKFDLYRKMTNLASLDMSAIRNSNSGRMIDKVYESVGLDIMFTDGDEDTDAVASLYGGIDMSTFNSIGKGLFNLAPVSSSSIATEFNSSTAANYQPNLFQMLVPNSWGGSALNVDDDHALSTVELQLGDLIVIRTGSSEFGSTGTYITALYQGLNADGVKTFIVGISKASDPTCAVMTYDDVLNLVKKTQTFTIYGWDAETETNVERTFTTSKNAIGYFVLRPSMLAPRNVYDGALTDLEKDALKLNAATSDFGGKGVQEFIHWAFGNAGVDVSELFTKNAYYTHYAIYNSNGPMDVNDDFDRIAVADSWGGTIFKNNTEPQRLASFEVGDITFGRIEKDYTESGKREYCAAIYLGDGKFLFCTSVEGSSVGSSASTAATVLTFPFERATDATDETTGEPIMETVESIYDYFDPWHWCYTLRIDQLFS